MQTLLSLDAHAHLDPARTANELASSGAVLAMTFALEEATFAVERRDGKIATQATTGMVIEELQRRPIAVPVIHGRWMGTVAETRAAVALGCYFSIHSQVARYSKFRTAVPLERVFVETDHGIGDPPAAIPCRIEWVEHLVAQQYGIGVEDVRCLVWQNFKTIISQTNIHGLVPKGLAAVLAENRGG